MVVLKFFFTKTLDSNTTQNTEFVHWFWRGLFKRCLLRKEFIREPSTAAKRFLPTVTTHRKKTSHCENSSWRWRLYVMGRDYGTQQAIRYVDLQNIRITDTASITCSLRRTLTKRKGKTSGSFKDFVSWRWVLHAKLSHGVCRCVNVKICTCRKHFQRSWAPTGNQADVGRRAHHVLRWNDTITCLAL